MKKAEITKTSPFDQIKFDNSYARLPEQFYVRQKPLGVKEPQLVIFNHSLSKEIGLEKLSFSDKEAAQVFSGNHTPQGADPLAMVYAGHQFGGFVPRLGDGRAVLLGEVIDTNGQRRDIHFKGTGKTPYARGADGRSPLGPAMREYIISEGMNTLGIPTTRSLAVVTTGETVMRERSLPGAVLTRIALSHIRVGTFEYFAARDDINSIRILADYAIDRLYPHLKDANNPYIAFLDKVVERQAHLIAGWMNVGFIHGVMNTDNMTISGETIDFGPCAFLDHYDPASVFSSIDRMGRYAFGNQATIARWNLARLAEALLPLLDENEKKAITKAESSVHNFTAHIEDAWYRGIRKKLGLKNEAESDVGLIGGLLRLMYEKQADYTLTFRELCGAIDSNAVPSLGNSAEVQEWLKNWRLRLKGGSSEETGNKMRKENPIYIPRNHLVEKAISDAVDQNSFEEMNTLLKAISDPFTERKEFSKYGLPPLPEERVLQTYCGT